MAIEINKYRAPRGSRCLDVTEPLSSQLATYASKAGCTLACDAREIWGKNRVFGNAGEYKPCVGRPRAEDILAYYWEIIAPRDRLDMDDLTS